MFSSIKHKAVQNKMGLKLFSNLASSETILKSFTTFNRRIMSIIVRNRAGLKINSNFFMTPSSQMSLGRLPKFGYKRYIDRQLTPISSPTFDYSQNGKNWENI